MCTLTIRLQQMNKKDKANYKLQSRNVKTSRREGIKMVQHF